MNIRFLTILSLTASSLLNTGCSDTNAFKDPAVTATENSTVQTQVPDQNSLTLSAEKIAVEALNYVGETMDVTVFASDRNNNPVPDNTAINFITNGGRIDPRCLTSVGVCTVVWTDTNPEPATNQAIVIAYTTGEESFTDLNDNDLYDAGEPFTDITEPFFDINNNGVRDAASEAFIDADNDQTFDVADGLFTGTPCIGDSTVCNRISTLIWERRNIILSGSFATITQLSGTFPATDDTTVTFLFSITDTNGNPMPDGTTVTISAQGGAVTPSSIGISAGGTVIATHYTSDATPGGANSITVEVETPNNNISSASF